MAGHKVDVTPIHEALIILRNGLSRFVADCFESIDPNSGRPWWETVERKLRKLRVVLSRDPARWDPDEVLNAMAKNWGAFEFKTILRHDQRKPSDHAAKGWVEYLLELRRRTMHQVDEEGGRIGPAEVLDFLRCAELLLNAAKADVAADKVVSLRAEFLRAGGGSAWLELISSAVRTKAIRLALELPKLASVQTRSLGPVSWKDEFEPPRFAQDDRVRLEVDLQEAGADLVGPRYCVCLVVDAEQVTCLCPNSAIAPDSHIQSATFGIPPSGSQPLVFYGATGRHSLYLIVAGTNPSESLGNLLQRPQPLQALENIAEAILASSKPQVLKTEFLVI